MITPLSVIGLCPTSRESLESFVSYVADSLESGSIDPLEIYTQCIAMEKAMQGCKDVLQAYATQEAQKHNGGKEFEKQGFKIKVGEVGVKYHFDNCNDPILKDAEFKFEAAKATVDDRKKFLKTIKSPTTLVNEETSEIYTINPAPKTSTTSVIMTMK